MQIHVLAVGKIREGYLQEGIEEYAKRLRSYTTLHIQEVPDERAPPRASAVQKEKTREKEGDHLLAVLPSGACIIALHPAGKELTSEEFADRIGRWEVEGPHTLGFLIGGELGLSDAVLAAADLQMSLSRMTFPHQMVRLILLESLYRAFRRVRGEPYHR
jgi:23S rRNA (pseudouridine1915-N3)-methyltransferase